MNTHGVKINYGKYSGELITRLPISYIRWMINQNAPMVDYARAELERRGDTMPTVEISGHAIDKASLRVRKIWHETRGQEEGLYSWLSRIVLEALEKGEKMDEEQYYYLGMKLVVARGAEFPSLKSIMPSKKKLDKSLGEKFQEEEEEDLYPYHEEQY